MELQNIVERLERRSETVAFCESVTAGLVSGVLAGVPGVSKVLKGGLVTYATEAKAHFLDTSVEQLEQQGVISEATAKQMARAALDHFGSTWGISVTGVAGPDSQEGFPPGTVFLGIAHVDGTTLAVPARRLGGGRFDIRKGAAIQALGLLLRQLDAKDANDGEQS